MTSPRPKILSLGGSGQTTELSQWLATTGVTTIGSYRVGKTVGEGTFGKVKMGHHVYTGLPVAIKIVDKIHAPAVAREIDTWRHLRHPNIVQLYEVICSETKIYMVTEFCSGGEVLEYICQNGRLDDMALDTKKIFWQIVDGIRFCHEKNYVHRDLKLENILLDSQHQVKIADFGFTKSVESNKLLDTFCGSIAYAAPEIVAAQKYSGKLADVWSLGVIFYTLVVGYLPFDEDNETEMHKKIVDLEFEIPDFLDQDTMDLLNAMLVLDPQKRPPAQDILNHKWFDALKGLSPPLEPYQCPDPTTHLSSKEAVHIFHHLRTLGFDAPSILQSVKQDACDSLCAMWYLLKLKLGNAATESSFGEDCPPNLDSLVLGIVNSNPRGSPGSSTWLSPQTATTPFGGGAQEPSIRRAPWVTESSRVKGPMGMGSLHRSHQAPGSPGLAGTLSSKKGQPRPQSAGATVHRNHTFSTSSRRSSTVMEECEEDDEF